MKLAEKFLDLVNVMMKGLLSVSNAGVYLPRHVESIQVYMEETARAAARIAYRDCASVAKLAQEQAITARNEASPTTQQYAALDGAVGAFGGMALTYQRFEATFCDGKEYKDKILPSDMDTILGPTSSITKEHKLKDPRKKDPL